MFRTVTTTISRSALSSSLHRLPSAAVRRLPLRSQPVSLLANTATSIRAFNSSAPSFYRSTSSFNMSSSDAAPSTGQPIYEQSVGKMKAYLDEYGVSHKHCVEKTELIALVKQTLENPPAKKPAGAAAASSSSSSSGDTVGEEIVNLLGDKLLGKSGKFNTTALQAKVVALYFSAHWCPPCRQFTPVLKQLYESEKFKEKGVEIVFVSSDQDASAFSGYYGEQPWLALPYDDRGRKEDVSSVFGISGIPSLIVLNGSNGEVLSKDGRRDVMSKQGKVAQYWLDLAASKKK